MDDSWAIENFATCVLGDKRLTRRALEIGKALVLGFGQALSMVFGDENALACAYEFFSNPKTCFLSLTQPHREATLNSVSSLSVVLAVGDKTFLDYKAIVKKREGFGPIGKGGNGLLLHSSLAVEPEQGQPLGLLWHKLWHRETQKPAPTDETAYQRRQRKAKEHKAKRSRPFEQKESYSWVESMVEVEQALQQQLNADQSSLPRVIHVFDREGDISEVFDQQQQLDNTGVVVRATHNRALGEGNEHLWEFLKAQPIAFHDQVDLAETPKRAARTATLAVRFAPVQLKCPSRLGSGKVFNLYGVYATEVDPPEGEEPVSWMLLTSEGITTQAQAQTILRWYAYRWRIEDYHKILKSGCRAERYRLAGASTEVLLGFLTVIAVQLLRVTHLHRTQPEAPAQEVLRPEQLAVLKAKATQLPKVLTVAWAIEAVARLGGYLKHRRKTPLGITVLWRGWLKLEDLCEGWKLARET